MRAGRANSVPFVAVDQFAGAVSATQLLLHLGHQTVWHIAGPRDFLEAQQDVRERWKAYKAAGHAVVYWQQTASGGWEKKA